MCRVWSGANPWISGLSFVMHVMMTRRVHHNYAVHSKRETGKKENLKGPLSSSGIAELLFPTVP